MAELVAHEPKIVLRDRRWREKAARFRPAHRANHLHRPADLAGAAGCWILATLRHEAAIDHDETACREPGPAQTPNSRVPETSLRKAEPLA